MTGHHPFSDLMKDWPPERHARRKANKAKIGAELTDTTAPTRTISVPRDEAGIELIDALQDFARSRASKTLIRRGQDRDVRCDLRVPLFRDCRISSRALGRGLRKLLRETIEGGEPGDRAMIDFANDADSNLVLTVSARDAAPPERGG